MRVGDTNKYMKNKHKGKNLKIMFDISVNFHHISIMATQYGGFLAFILIVELIIAASIYAYKNRLADGFDKGLEISMNPDDPQRNLDIYWVQRNVCNLEMKLILNYIPFDIF